MNLREAAVGSATFRSRNPQTDFQSTTDIAVLGSPLLAAVPPEPKVIAGPTTPACRLVYEKFPSAILSPRTMQIPAVLFVNKSIEWTWPSFHANGKNAC